MAEIDYEDEDEFEYDRRTIAILRFEGLRTENQVPSAGPSCFFARKPLNPPCETHSGSRHPSSAQPTFCHTQKLHQRFGKSTFGTCRMRRSEERKKELHDMTLTINDGMAK